MMNCRLPGNRQGGFSMIELLVSLLVATIIIMGVYRFLTGSHRSFTFTKANDNVNRTMMVSNRTMSNYMKLAGFRNYRRVIDNITFDKETVNFGKGDIVFPRNTFIMGNSSGLTIPAVDATPNDILYIRYFGSSVDDDLSEKTVASAEVTAAKRMANDRMYDCQGNFLHRMQEAFLMLYVTNNDEGRKGLICRQVIRDFTDAGGHTDSEPEVIELNPNVISILFGYRVDGDESFHLASEVESADASGIKMSSSNFELVNALRYGILVKQDTHQKVTRTTNAQEFHMLGFPTDDDLANIAANETDIYQLVSGILFMRNRFIEDE